MEETYHEKENIIGNYCDDSNACADGVRREQHRGDGCCSRDSGGSSGDTGHCSGGGRGRRRD